MLKVLPIATASQTWCCEAGCGDCAPKQIDFEYSRETAPDGTLIESKTTPIWVSHCCDEPLMLWDAATEDFVELDN